MTMYLFTLNLAEILSVILEVNKNVHFKHAHINSIARETASFALLS